MTTPLHTAVTAAFGAVAADYDQGRRRLIPSFGDFYGTVGEILPFVASDRPLVLDLGSGTGLLAETIRSRCPLARLVLMDGSEAMLDVARHRFDGDAEVRFHVGNYAEGLPPGPYDAVVSALSIHHLEDPDKRTLFRRILDALRPGGRFVDADLVMAPTEVLAQRHQSVWEARVRALGTTDTELLAAIERGKLDRLAPLSAQLAWLTEAGFVEVDCAYKNFQFAVFGGERPSD